MWGEKSVGRIYGDKEISKKRMRRSTIDGEGQNGKKEKRGKGNIRRQVREKEQLQTELK